MTSTIDLTTCPLGPVMATADMDRAAAFYEGTLGLVPGDAGDVMRLYPCGHTSLAVYVSPDHAGSCTATMAAWAVPDVPQARAALEERGVTFEAFGDADNAFFRDPDGNTFVLVRDGG